MTFEPEHPDLVSLVRAAIDAHAGNRLFGEDRGDAFAWHTYGEIGARVDRMRAALARLGVAGGDRVGIVSANRVEWLVCAAATHGLGAVVVPMYEMQHEKDWLYILRDSSAKACFASTREIYDKIASFRGELPALAHLVGFARDASDDSSYAHLLASDAPAVPEVRPAPRDPAFFIYTSGTTGNPKGVRLAHANMSGVVCGLAQDVQIRSSSRLVSILPWAHVGGLNELYFVCHFGAAIALPAGADHIAAAIAATKPTQIVGVPRIWNKFFDAIHKSIAERSWLVRWAFGGGLSAIKKERRGAAPTLLERLARFVAVRLVFPKILERMGGALEFVLSGAAALSPDVGEFLECLGIPVLEAYGMTEVAGVVVATRVERRKLGTVGMPLSGTAIKIDRSLGSTEAGDGEILIYGVGVMLGYHGHPEETAAAMTEDGGVRTGDLGTFDDEGYLKITGRVREVYKLENGKFVTPVPIEEKMTLSPYIAQAMLYGLNKPHNVALVVLDVPAVSAWAKANGVDPSPDALVRDARVRALVAKEIEAHTAGVKGYERVKDFVLTAEDFTTANDMLTPTLKMKRRNVLAKYAAALEALYR